MAQNVSEVMTANPRTVGSSTSVLEAARLMKSEDVGSLPILEDERLIGVVTDRDITIRVAAEGKDPQSTTVGEIASRDVVTIDSKQSLDEAARLMAQNQVRRLPVVEEDGKLVGIVAQADVAQEGKDSLTGDLVQQISR
jgi:CBS domain-containing protein